MTTSRVAGGARARARQVMHAQVAEIVMDLVLEHGYEETTVDDICAAAEISRSTFFRYFPSKEDALFGGMTDAGERLRDAHVARPQDETAWVALRRALDPLNGHYNAEDARIKGLTRLMFSSPALTAYHRKKNARWHELLRTEIARRLGTDPADTTDPRADAVIAAALGCVEAALRAWSAHDRAPALGETLDRAMGAIG
jgi:AcrR family transcriptional regulator